MKVLLVGSGGREHALAWKLSQSPRLGRLFAWPGSSAIGALAERLEGDALDTAGIVKACRDKKIDLVVVGPEAPLAAGLVDDLAKAGVKAFGPKREAARLESSKAYGKDFMRRHGAPTAKYEVHNDPAKARDAAAELPLPLVVKADGLASGKGVRVCRTRKEAVEAVQDFMMKGTLGQAGAHVVLEECLTGPEATIMAFCDGETLKTMPVGRDHKRLLDGDQGPNTGGMGAVAPVEMPEQTASRIKTEILDRVAAGLKADGMEYRGVLYFGLMLTADGPKVLEFNVRLGDPETQAVLPLLKTDLLEVIDACLSGKLAGLPIEFRERHAACVVLASPGYPAAPVQRERITGLEVIGELGPDLAVFHAGTIRLAEGWMTNGGRVLNVVGWGKSADSARDKAYEAVRRLHFEGVQYRKDIGLTTAPAAEVNP